MGTKMLFPHIDAASREIRNKVFFHASAAATGTPHAPSPMANWYSQAHPELTGDVHAQWRRASHGHTLAEWVRSDLYHRFPVLQRVFDNPLWKLMSARDAAVDWDGLAATIQVADKPLDGLTGNLTKYLLERVDWECFCAHLVLMNTRHSRFLFHRQWLAKNFVRIFALVSIQSPIIYCCSDVHCQLTRPHFLFNHEYPGMPWAGWPELHQLNLELVNRCCMKDWLSSHDQQLALLLWNLSPVWRRTVVNLLYGEDDGASSPMPRTVQQFWRRKRLQWEDHPVSLNGYCCAFPGIEWLYDSI